MTSLTRQDNWAIATEALSSASASGSSQAAEDSHHQNDSASSSKEDSSLPSSFSPSMDDGSNNAMLVPAKEQSVSTLDDINSQHSAESVNSEQQLALRIDKETKAHHHLMRLLKEMDLGDETSDPSKGEAVASLIGDFERDVTLIQQKIQNETLLKNTAENAPLPPGWIALECPDSLDIYYVNEETGESTWDRPGLGIEGEANELLLNDSSSAQSNDTSVQNESDGESDGDYSGSTLPPDWIALEDPDSGEMYYANEVTGVTTWERPEAETVESNTYNEHSVSSGYDDNSQNEQTPSVRFDDTSNARSVSSQQNEEASESSFQHDAHGHESSYNTQSSDQEGSYTASYDTKSNNSSFNISGQTSAEEEDDDDDDDEDLPEGWYSAIDPNSNERYYCNDETGESQWERPEREEDEYEEEDGSEASEELPEGWEAILDPSSGDYYYYKAEDGTTTWEKPVADNFNQAPMQASHESNNTSQGELPENWFAIDDPVSGDTYYYNEVTNETSWEIPTDTNNLMSRLSVNDNNSVVYEEDSVTSSKYY